MPYDRKAVKLPGRGRKHALLKFIEQKKITYADVARALDVTPQAFACWVRECEENRNFLLPAEHVPTLARTLKIPPAWLRPDLYMSKWRFR